MALVLLGSVEAKADEFDPRAAFCDRQTMVLLGVGEAEAWLDYLGGLRTGRSQPPDPDTCASSTLRSVFAAVTQPEMAADLRLGLVRFYAQRAMEPDSAARAGDMTGAFRYLNDLTAASLLWLTCPSVEGSRVSCFGDVLAKLPSEYLETSPVFCDFAVDGRVQDVELPDHALEALPGLCTPDITNTIQNDWLDRLTHEMEK